MRFLVEQLEDDEVDIYYDDLTITVIRDYVDQYDYEQYDTDITYTYTITKSDVYETIEDDIIREMREKDKELDWPTESQRDKYFNDNFESLFNKYNDKILDRFRDDAREQAEENYGI